MAKFTLFLVLSKIRSKKINLRIISEFYAILLIVSHVVVFRNFFKPRIPICTIKLYMWIKTNGKLAKDDVLVCIFY